MSKFQILTANGHPVTNGSVEIHSGKMVIEVAVRGPIETISAYHVGSRSRAMRRWAGATAENLQAALRFAERTNEAAEKGS